MSDLKKIKENWFLPELVVINTKYFAKSLINGKFES